MLPVALIVQKLGGTSVSDAEKIHRAARRAIRAKMDGAKVVLVVSAMGRTTDKLLALAREVSADSPNRELDMLLTTGEQVSIAEPIRPPSSSGLGYQVLILKTGVRVPVGVSRGRTCLAVHGTVIAAVPCAFTNGDKRAGAAQKAA